MYQHLERGNFLFNQSRYADAEKEYKKILAYDPNNAYGLASLAQCYLETDRKKEALNYAQKAIQNAPDSPTMYLIYAKCLFYNKLIDKALNAIESGQQLNPSISDFFLLKARIAFYQDNWQLALDETEHGLELEPEDVSLINLRARALVKLNRSQEASVTMDYALHQAPLSSYSHANKGWVSIERGQYEEAVSHFKESLRLNATNAYAKAGLREAIKAKNILYRGVLKYFLWMSKLQEKYRWGFVIGTYLLYQLAISLAQMSSIMAMVMTPLIILFIIFAFSSWIAMPISNLFLRLHPLGKFALEEDEKLASNVVGIVASLSILNFIIFFLTGGGFDIGEEEFTILGYEGFFLTGLVLLLMTIPIGGLFMSTVGTVGRRNLAIYTGILALFALLAIITKLELLFLIFFLGILGFSFAANYIIGKGAKEL